MESRWRDRARRVRRSEPEIQAVSANGGAPATVASTAPNEGSDHGSYLTADVFYTAEETPRAPTAVVRFTVIAGFSRTCEDCGLRSANVQYAHGHLLFVQERHIDGPAIRPPAAGDNGRRVSDRGKTLREGEVGPVGFSPPPTPASSSTSPERLARESGSPGSIGWQGHWFGR